MRTNATETSRDCFHDHVIPNLAAGQCNTIAMYVLLTANHKVTRGMIAESLGMEKSTVSARVNALIAAKVLIVMRDDKGEKIKARCPISGIKTEWLVHSLNAEKQLKLI